MWDAVMSEEKKGQKPENKLCCVNHLLGSTGQAEALCDTPCVTVAVTVLQQYFTIYFRNLNEIIVCLIVL
jgi:hypothetical protein